MTTTQRTLAAAALLLLAAGCATPAPPQTPWLDFATFERGLATHSAVACNQALCPSAQANRGPLVLAASAANVAAALRQLEPTAVFRTRGNGDVQARYVAVTAVLRFRDDVDVLIHPVSDQSTEVAVYSRSRVGVSDLGANAARIDALETRLRQALGQ